MEKDLKSAFRLIFYAGKAVFNMLSAKVKIAIALFLILALFAVSITYLLPSAIWSPVNGALEEMEGYEKDFEKVMELEDDLIKIIKDYEEKCLESEKEKIRDKCRELNTNYTISLSNLIVDDSEDETELSKIYIAFGLANLDNHFKSGFKIKREFRKALDSFLEKGSFYELSYEKDNSGNVKVYETEIKEVDDKGEIKTKTIKYIVPSLKLKPIDTLAEDMFDINSESLLKTYGNDNLSEIIDMIFSFNNEILGRESDSDEDAIDNLVKIKIKIKLIDNKIKLKFSGGINTDEITLDIQKSAFETEIKDKNIKLDINKNSNLYNFPFESQYDQSKWKIRLSPDSEQIKLNKKCRDDSKGFRRYGEDFLVAMGSYYGRNIGKDRFKIGLLDNNGNLVYIYATLGDMKADIHTNPTHQYQKWDKSVVEFIMSGESYTKAGINKNAKAIKNSFTKLVSIEKTGVDISIKGKIDEERIEVRGKYNNVPYYAEGRVKGKEFEITGYLGSESQVKLVDIARRYIGNIGGSQFKKYASLRANDPWCAAFVSYILEKSGYTYPKFTYCPDGIRIFKAKGRFKKTNPKPGDIVFYDWNNDNISDHVGIVEKADDRFIYTVEGNTSGFGYYDNTVNEKKMAKNSKRASCIIGYGTP